ncbi:hypothetical protein QQS21_006766 [Conoideocrella luteorostrata]|uniref:N-acetyltransferase domain-containing protein n=1 Tax=Conoideocrella luteorostrata TaxID=1105319 RepID=A0AAJ0CR97_9HYPO|nr:hypothetical protein QQS21_006766 [Conoideocrella luteorostrata]
MDVTWFPDDSSRKFVEAALDNYGMPRYKAAQRPHIRKTALFFSLTVSLQSVILTPKQTRDLFNVFTHPDYRGRGIGQQFTNWGMMKADELGLEFFLDATLPGKPLYEANRFICVEENATAPTTSNADDKWREIEAKVSPFTFWLMWRPVGGKYEEGKTVKPWETG